MGQPDPKDNTTSRRLVLQAMGASALIAGCDFPPDGDEGGESGGDECDPALDWATGGTASMTAKDCYPDPFVGELGVCALFCEMTEGPCTSESPTREDISEGLTGLPIRLAIRVVTAGDCKPVKHAQIEIWHAQRTGVYSGVTPGGAFCYGNDPDAEAFLYFRGNQETDADGQAFFDTCYPGWYPGRAVHIHFRISLDGEQFMVSQFFFPDSLNEELCTTHPEYLERGVPDTLNTDDAFISGEDDLSPYLLETERMADGAMLAYKTVAIRSSLDQDSCQSQGDFPDGPPPLPPMP